MGTLITSDMHFAMLLAAQEVMNPAQSQEELNARFERYPVSNRVKRLALLLIVEIGERINKEMSQQEDT